MALKAKTPTAKNKRLKVLFFGPAGCGKTTAAIQFPRPYLIDTERGAENEQYVKLLKDRGGVSMFTTDADELLAEVRSLLSEKHDYRTLIIDPLTVIYNDMLDTEAEKGGTEFGRHKIGPDRKIKRLLSLLTRLDMNVIITSHAKPNWVRAKDKNGKDTAVQEGMTYDCYGRLDYVFDLVVEVGKRGKERVGTIRKTRMENFPEGEVIPFNYDQIAELYGRADLERDAVPVQFASADAVKELRRLIDLIKVNDDTVEAWLKKAEAERLEDMTAEAVEKCICFLTAQVKGVA